MEYKSDLSKELREIFKEEQDGIAKSELIKIDFSLLCNKIYSFEDTDVLFLGDSDHNNGELKSLLHDSNLMQSLKGLGLEVIMIEHHSDYVETLKIDLEEVFNRFSQAELEYVLSKDGLRTSERLWLLAKKCFDLDIKLFGVDQQKETTKTSFMESINDRSIDEILEHFKHRLSLDSLVNEKVVNHFLEHGKGLLIYGEGHGYDPGDGLLDDPRINMIKVSVYSDLNSYKKQKAEFDVIKETYYPNGAESNNYDFPHFSYLVDEGSVLAESDESALMLSKIIDSVSLQENQKKRTESILHHTDSTFKKN
ncbi:MAG: hypothetical protein R8G66_02835 [Cytophagales bacterium]|nr:hypothetical protein [Cytophagales bacterium]